MAISWSKEWGQPHSLDPATSPLYFSELANIINREWELFQNILEMDKSKFLIILDELNLLRKDAHANQISDDEFAQVRLYFKKLEGILSHWV